VFTLTTSTTLGDRSSAFSSNTTTAGVNSGVVVAPADDASPLMRGKH
jgi:hypothetical protein